MTGFSPGPGAGEAGGGAGETEVEVLTVRPLEGPKELSTIVWRIERRGAGCRVLARQRGFAVDEEFWPVAERFRLVPAMAIARGAEDDRLLGTLVALEAALGREGAVRREVELDAPLDAVYNALTLPVRIAAWLPGEAEMVTTTPDPVRREAPGQGGPPLLRNGEGPRGIHSRGGVPVAAQRGGAPPPWTAEGSPHPGGRFAWTPAGKARAERGRYLEVEPDRRLVFTFEGPGRPTIVAIDLVPGDRERTRIELVHTGFAGAPELLAAEAALWGERLERLAAFVEGRVERRFAVAAGIDRAAAALREEAELRGWLDPGAAVETEPERALRARIAPGLDPQRCPILADEAPRRLALGWYPLEPDGSARTTLAVTLDEADSGGTAVRVAETGFAEGFRKRELLAEAAERLAFIERSLAAHLDHGKGLAAEAGGAPALGVRTLALERDLPLGPDAAYATISGHVRKVFGRALDDEPGRRLVLLSPAGPGEPAGVTIVTVALEGLPEGRTRVRVTEEGFRDGPRWETRWEIAERGWRGLLDRLGGPPGPG